MEKRYESCTLTDLARLTGDDPRTFQNRLLRDDLLEMIRLGWDPFCRSLPPSVVRYLREKFIDNQPTQSQ